jgi:ornithine carbamoyltransferase
LASAASVPVINALTDGFHPCQVLADLLTIRESLGALAGLRLTYLGDGANNMAHSYLLGGSSAGMHVTIAAPADRAPDPSVLATAAAIATRTGGSIHHEVDPVAAVTGTHVLATDVWLSMGDGQSRQDQAARLRGYALDEGKLTVAAPDAVVLHCLPAHRGEEITASVLDGPRSLVWRQAENRLHIQKALLSFLLTASEATL